MEFKLTNPASENGFIQKIEFNFEEIKTELVNRLEKYENLTYTEDTIRNAKDDKAGLNKFKEAIETRRKEIKKLCLKPYDEFETKVKELVGLIDKPIIAIDTQLKKFEDKRIAEKQAEIQQFFENSIGNLKELLSFEKIFSQKWLNATYKMANIQKEIIETIGKVSGDLKVIEDLKLNPDVELQVRDKYLQTLDFGLAMAEKTRLENLKKVFKERETIQNQEQFQHEQDNDKNEAETTPELKNELVEQAIYTRKFWVSGTKEQLQTLGKYLKENGLKYGGIE